MSENVRSPQSRARLLRPVLLSAVFFMLLTGIAYPLATTAVATVAFPSQASGSLVVRGGTTVGSSLIGQSFAAPGYFHPRPSVTSGSDPEDPSKTVAVPYNGGLSGASNQGSTNQKLLDDVATRATAYRAENGMAPEQLVPVDAVTASGSGLDPDISVANASIQIARVAQARGIPEARVRRLVETVIAPRVFGLLGEPRVNVLQLNLALDQL